MRITDYQGSIFNKIIDDYSKSFIDSKELEYLKENCDTGYIYNGMEYRPDRVAGYYLGDPKLAWLITYVNDFTDGIRDYKPGIKIKIPTRG